MIRKKKLYVRPRKAFEKTRIQEENALMEKYALKNKREIWKTLAKVNYFRSRAKDLAGAPHEEQKVFFGKLKALGLNTDSIADVLALNIDNLLQRRLPSVLHKKGLATTVGQARQMVVHKNVSISGRVVNIPSYLVPVHEESHITAKLVPKPVKHHHKSEEATE